MPAQLGTIWDDRPIIPWWRKQQGSWCYNVAEDPFLTLWGTIKRPVLGKPQPPVSFWGGKYSWNTIWFTANTKTKRAQHRGGSWMRYSFAYQETAWGVFPMGKDLEQSAFDELCVRD